MESEYESESESDSETEDVPRLAPHDKNFTHLFRWLLIFLLSWQIAHCISAVAMNELLTSIATAFSVAKTLVSSPAAIGLSAFPVSLFVAYRYLGIERDTFVKYALCPKCLSLYDYDHMLKANPDGSVRVKRCTYVEFPDHPQRNRRLSCSSPLVRVVHHSNGTKRLYALHCYVRKSLKDALQRILLRKNIHLQLESWRKRNMPVGFYGDVYDGRVWKHFVDELLHKKRTLALMLNFDFFQPFKHCTDSIGAIYLVLVNLPRKERYKRENVILAGLIPSLESEPNTLNTFLSPLISELQDLWKGIRMYTSESPSFKVLVRGALICAACDIPAARKVCGFKGHNANHGCSRCFIFFPGPITKKDYSGFDRENWPPRDIDKHRTISKKIKHAKTLQARNDLEVANGMYYSIMSELEYFNPILHTIIDPMHNLFLGTAKKIFKKIWIPRGLLKEKELKEIQARVDCVAVPSTIGRIPRKIASAFGGFTAEQWLNWTLVYSLYALRGLIGKEHYECWRSFVLACRLLTLPVLSDIDIKKADLLLLNFCRKVEILYGKQEITPNMHLHGHLSECIHDYGPMFGFWLFSFERYNGMLGKFPNNQKHIEVQLMRRFETEMQLHTLSLPQMFQDQFFHLLESVTGGVHDKDKCLDEPQIKFGLYCLSNSDFRDDSTHLLLKESVWRVSNRWKMKLLSSSELICFSRVLHHLFKDQDFIPQIDHLPKQIRCYQRIEFGSEVYSVHNDSRYGRHSNILARWAGDAGDIETKSDLRPGTIRQIFVYKFRTDKGETYSIPFAQVAWYRYHPNKALYGNGLDLWHRDSHEAYGSSSYIPIACINSKFAPAYGSIRTDGGCHPNFESVMFVCPLRSKHFV